MIDPLLGMAFGFVLVWASWGILRDAAHLLMEGTPDTVSLASVVRELETIEGVEDAHHVHAWALTSGRYVFSGHLRIHPESDSERILRAAHAMLKEKSGFFFATLQLETTCLDEAESAAIDVQQS